MSYNEKYSSGHILQYYAIFLLNSQYEKRIMISMKLAVSQTPGKHDSPPATPLFIEKERSMHTVPDFASHDKLYTPRPGAPVRHSHYFGFSGYLTVDADMTPLFRTSGTLWKPVSSFNELVILAEVGPAECQRVLDTLAGGYAAIATSRQNLEV